MEAPEQQRLPRRIIRRQGRRTSRGEWACLARTSEVQRGLAADVVLEDAIELSLQWSGRDEEDKRDEALDDVVA